jgi:hypothetical protein
MPVPVSPVNVCPSVSSKCLPLCLQQINHLEDLDRDGNMEVPMFVIEKDQPSRTMDTIFFNLRILVSNKLRTESLNTKFRVALVVSRCTLTAEVWVRSQATLYGFCGLQSDNGTGFFSRISVFPLSVSFRQFPIIIFIYMFLLPCCNLSDTGVSQRH